MKENEKAALIAGMARVYAAAYVAILERDNGVPSAVKYAEEAANSFLGVMQGANLDLEE